jgi:hypothetical protein
MNLTKSVCAMEMRLLLFDLEEYEGRVAQKSFIINTKCVNK